MCQHLTVKQVAERWQSGLDHIYEMIRQGELPAINTAMSGSQTPRYRIRVEDVLAFEDARMVEPIQPLAISSGWLEGIR
jgi:excisionase family DNA binding protein